MTIIIAISFLLLGLFTHTAHRSYVDKVNEYILKNKGELIKAEFRKLAFHIYNNVNKEVVINYKDQHNNLREVSLYYHGFISYFGADKITEYAPSSPEYAEQKRKQMNSVNASVEFNDVDYKLKSQETLTIKQEYTHPNIGEFAYINDRPAPSGKYKIGLFTYISVENGRIVAIR